MADGDALIELKLEHITKQLSTLLEEVRADRQHARETFLPREVYVDRHNALRTEMSTAITTVARDVADLEKARDDEAKYRRQTWTAVGLTFVTALVGIIVGLVSAGIGVPPS